MKRTRFEYSYNPKSEILDVILHGGSHGIDSSLIQKLISKSKQKGNSVIAFNFPYFERGDEHSSGPELKEELETLSAFLEYCEYKSFKHVRLIAKSMGGIIASYFVNSLDEKEQENFEVVILGYVIGEVKLSNFIGKVTVVQGEKDKFGDVNMVKDDLKNAKSRDISYVEIPGADHSYRVPETKEPIFEDLAIEKVD